MPRRRSPRKTPAAAPQPARREYKPDWPVTALGGLGLAITAYLVLTGLFGAAPAGCGVGSSCDLVQQSRWSMLLGLPVALWGFGLYLLITLVAALSRPRARRWQRLLGLSFFGLAFSLYLTVVAWLELGALCSWCSASLLNLALIFGLVVLRRPDSGGNHSWTGWLTGQAAIVAVLLIGLHAVYAGWFEAPEDPRLRALAEHLDRVGAVYYGASWCPSCQEQTRLFGAAARHLPYVECSPQGRNGPVAFECAANEISTYPTWIIGNRRLTELQTPEDLARYARFNWAGWSE